jgi:hypothetical protein
MEINDVKLVKLTITQHNIHKSGLLNTNAGKTSNLA